MTQPTCELLEIMLKDAAFLEKRDTEWENKRRRRAGKPEIEPLFTLQDAEAALSLCEGINYTSRHQVASGVDINFRDAGHGEPEAKSVLSDKLYQRGWQVEMPHLESSVTI